MDETMKKQFTVNGFTFGSADDVELAETELSTVKYIDKKIENRSADTILSVYQGVIERKMLRTPIGYSYLHDLQKRMIKGGIPKENIQGIPMFQVFSESKFTEEPRERTTYVQKKKKKDELRSKNRMLVIVNLILVAIIIALFVITLNASNPNILNYRKAITNEYSSWEQELTEREKAVREKERELNIEVDYGLD